MISVNACHPLVQSKTSIDRYVIAWWVRAEDLIHASLPLQVGEEKEGVKKGQAQRRNKETAEECGLSSRVVIQPTFKGSAIPTEAEESPSACPRMI